MMTSREYLPAARRRRFAGRLIRAGLPAVLMLAALPGGMAVAAPAAPAPLTTEQRLERLERMLDNQGLVDLLMRLEALQAEVQRLRGEVEVQTHTIEALKKRQRELYLDIDRRLLNVERNGGVATTRPGATPPAGPATPASPAAPASPTPAAPAPRAAAPATPATPRPAPRPGGEQKAYQHAFDLLRELRYDAAIAAFRQFLADYPNGRYAHIAQYWLAEANYAQRHFEDAIGDYRRLISRFPNSPKLAEALLKIGYSQYELGQYKEASETLRGLIKRYPGTTEAGQAQNLLKKIRLKQGR